MLRLSTEVYEHLIRFAVLEVIGNRWRVFSDTERLIKKIFKNSFLKNADKLKRKVSKRKKNQILR